MNDENTNCAISLPAVAEINRMFSHTVSSYLSRLPSFVEAKTNKPQHGSFQTASTTNTSQ